ncbi:hypothetical protein [Streptomyces sp. NPDC001404]|uniref:hypothetical protein n=1 Tax=Streptomyces sp. NPDC001404 TaxID=3364571 RepID=UPI0036C2FC6D
MAAIAPERTLQTLPTERMLADLPEENREILWALMELLGYEDGAATDDGGLDDQAERLAIAQQAADLAQIALPHGHELRQCNACSLLIDEYQAYETDGLVRCGEHHHDWAQENDENYGRDDTTFESYRD